MEDYKREQQLQTKLKEDRVLAELNASQLMAELELEWAKFEKERSQRDAQTTAFIQESNRLRSTAKEARSAQERDFIKKWKNILSAKRK